MVAGFFAEFPDLLSLKLGVPSQYGTGHFPMRERAGEVVATGADAQRGVESADARRGFFIGTGSAGLIPPTSIPMVVHRGGG